MSDKDRTNYVASGEIFGTVFLAWLLTYFIAGVPHWIQSMLFWLWVIPLAVIAVFLLVILALYAAFGP
jgi:hypothetical protein